MTRAEADRWATGSTYPPPVYHAARTATVSNLRREGFDLRRRSLKRAWGNGAYLSPDLAVAEEYVRLYRALGEPAVVLELRVRLTRVHRVALRGEASAGTALRQILLGIPGGVGRFVETVNALRGPWSDEVARPEALTQVLVWAGYDGLEIIDPGFDPTIGGTQLVVFDPQKVVIVHG